MILWSRKKNIQDIEWWGYINKYAVVHNFINNDLQYRGTGVSIETALVKEVKLTQINRYIDAIHTISIKKECITHKNNNLVEWKGDAIFFISCI